MAANCQKPKGGEGRFFTHQPTVLCPKIGKGFSAYHWGKRHHHWPTGQQDLRGLRSRLMPTYSLATNLSKGGQQMAPCAELRGWEG